MQIQFDHENAMNAGKGGALIEKSANYTGEITKAEIQDGNGQSKYIMFGFENDENEKSDFVRVYTKKKDGERAFGYNFVMSLMGLLELKSVSPVQVDDKKMRINEFIGERIGFGLQKEYYTKQTGEVGWKMNLVNFYDPETKQTYAEKTNGEEAKKYNKKIQDKKDSSIILNNNLIENVEEDLPF